MERGKERGGRQRDKKFDTEQKGMCDRNVFIYEERERQKNTFNSEKRKRQLDIKLFIYRERNSEIERLL